MSITSQEDALKLEDARAIDFHVHALLGSLSENQNMDPLTSSGAKALGGAGMQNDHSVAAIAHLYRELHMRCVMFPVDSETATGRSPLPLEGYLDAVSQETDTIIPFISLDPWKGKKALHELDYALTRADVRGVKFHPCTQEFSPDDVRFYPLFDRLQEAGLIALFHTGQTGIGKGMPGGGGIRLKYGNPMACDDLAVDFPDLRIVLAHPSVPWQDEAIAIASHKPNVYIDLSGWSPKYFPTNLVHQIGRALKTKVLFATDYPYLTPERWMQDFSQLDIQEDVKNLVFRENAINLLFRSSHTD